jgi:hypothetical protein
MSKQHLTAIKRRNLSAPANWLYLNRHLPFPGMPNYYSILDYGCGRGDDVRHLTELGYDARGYDPHWGPEAEPWFEWPGVRFDVVLCTYVLNVVEPGPNRYHILDALRRCVKPEGRIFVTVRRDIKIDYTSSRGTKQWVVHSLGRMPNKKLIENSQFCIWELSP